MCGRCKSCNVVLTDDEMCAKWPNSEDYCELCTHCMHLSNPDAVLEADDFDILILDDEHESLV